MEYGYVVQLDDAVLTAPVEALRVGSYPHPVYGNIDITPERLQNFAASVNNKVRGIDADIDYAHKAKDDKAAGWVKSAEVKDDTLLLNVEWTDPAKEAISKREYRYFSPEFTDEWKDPDGNTHKDVLFGGGLTNRPFLKNLAPLNFSEYFAEVKTNPETGAKQFSWTDSENGNVTTIKMKDEEVNMDPKKLAEMLDLKPEEADEEKVLAKVKALTEAEPFDTKKLAEVLGMEEGDDIVASVTSLKSFYDTHEADANKAKKFAEEYPQEAARLQELAEKDKLQDTTIRLQEWKRGGLPPAVHDQVRDFRMSLGEDTKVKFDEIIKNVLDKGLVKLNIEGGGNLDPTEEAAGMKFEDKVEEIHKQMKEADENASYEDAVSKTAEDHKELYRAYLARP